MKKHKKFRDIVLFLITTYCFGKVAGNSDVVHFVKRIILDNKNETDFDTTQNPKYGEYI